jgi:hypothetical protein
MMSRTRCIVAALLVGGLAYPSPGQANDRSLRAVMIPASSCQVIEDTPLEGNPFKEQVDAISRLTPGTYRVVCPLPVNNIEMAGRRNDNDISRFRVTYRDTDGLDPAGEVLVFLQRISLAGDGSLTIDFLCDWSSNMDGSDEIGYTSDVVPCAHDVSPRSFYVFQVILSRTSADVYFIGIDFP